MVGAYAGVFPVRADGQLLGVPGGGAAAGGPGRACGGAGAAASVAGPRAGRPAAAHVRLLAYVMVELVRIGFGTQGLPVDTPDALQGAVDIGIGYFPLYRLFVIGVAALVVLALWLFLERTPFGPDYPGGRERPGDRADFGDRCRAASGCWCSGLAPRSRGWRGFWRRRCKARPRRWAPRSWRRRSWSRWWAGWAHCPGPRWPGCWSASWSA